MDAEKGCFGHEKRVYDFEALPGARKRLPHPRFLRGDAVSRARM